MTGKKRFLESGFVGPLACVSETDAITLAGELECLFLRLLRESGSKRDSLNFRSWEDAGHPLCDALASLITAPELAVVLERIFGSTVLLRNIDVFWKDPVPMTWALDDDFASEQSIEWHCDELTSAEADDMGTLWLSLSRVTSSCGPLTYVEGSHRVLLEHPIEARDDLCFGSARFEPLVQLPHVTPSLRPGECLIHHGNVVHRSGTNRSQESRIGIAFRVMGEGVSEEQAGCRAAVLLAGMAPEGLQVRDVVPITWWWPGESSKTRAEGFEENPPWLFLEQAEQAVSEVRASHVDGDLHLRVGLSILGPRAQGPKGWEGVRTVSWALFHRESERKDLGLYQAPYRTKTFLQTAVLADGIWRRDRGWVEWSLVFEDVEADVALELCLALVLSDAAEALNGFLCPCNRNDPNVVSERESCGEPLSAEH